MGLHPLVGAVHSPVNTGNIGIAVGYLSKRVCKATSLAALGQERNIRTPSGGSLSLDIAKHLHSRPEGQVVRASVEASTTNDVELRNGVGELGQYDAGLALAGVDAQGLLAVGARGVDGDTGREKRSSLVGEDVGALVENIRGGAVDVEDAASGGGLVGDQHGVVLASTDVVG